MGEWFEIKVRALLGSDAEDDKEVTILGRTVRWTKDGIEYEADKKHRDMLIDHFGFKDGTKGLTVNGSKVDNEKEDPEGKTPLDKEEAKIYRGLAARLNFLSLDCPDLQFPIKECSKDMANPTRDSFKKVKKIPV